MENMTKQIDQQKPKAKYPGWRTMTAAQRYNAKADRVWEAAREAQTRFNLASREPVMER